MCNGLEGGDYLSRIKSSSTSIFKALVEGWSDEKAMRCLGVSIQISRVFWANAMMYFLSIKWASDDA